MAVENTTMRLQSVVLDGLNINVDEYFSGEEFRFAEKLSYVSLNSRLIFEEQDDPVNFEQFLKRLKEDGVKEIDKLVLPVEESEDDENYLSLIESVMETCSCSILCCPFLTADGVKALRKILTTVVEKNKANIEIQLPNMRPYNQLTLKPPGGKHTLTLRVPENNAKNFTKGDSDSEIVIKEYKATQGHETEPPSAAANIFYNKGAPQELSLSLYFDSVCRSIKWSDTQFPFKKLKEIIRKTWCKLDQFGRSRFNGEPDARRGMLYQEEPRITIAVLDTAIRFRHHAFRNASNGVRIVEMKNFVPVNTEDRYEGNTDIEIDRQGHGTQCASIAAGGTFRAILPEPKSRYVEDFECGVAPFADIVVAKIADCKGNSKPEWMAAAINWIVGLCDDNKTKVDIITSSVGFRHFNPELMKAVSKANERGIIMTCAASNDGRRNMRNIVYPARFGNVICVGSHNDNGQASDFSPIGREIDFLAPGENIWCASSAHKSGIACLDGTSMATPFIAGISALILLAAQRIGGCKMRKYCSYVPVIREILIKMSSNPGQHDDARGYGNIDPSRVFDYDAAHFTKIVEDIYGGDRIDWDN